MTQRDGLRERVRERYAEAATTVLETGRQASCCDSDCGAGQGNSSVPCCGPTVIEVDETFGGVLYSLAEREELPVAAVAASLGLRQSHRRRETSRGPDRHQRHRRRRSPNS